MRPIRSAFVAACVVLISSTLSFAQSPQSGPAVTVPRLVHLTGVFQPVDGRPPAAVEVVTLSIYAEPESGLPVWQEQQSVAVDRTGRFTLLLGASDPAGIPAEVFGSGQAQWMSVLFERAGEVEQPRVRIASVPYALRASDAETLGGLPASAYALAPTGASASGTAPVQEASVSAAVSGPVLETSDVVLAGTTNYLAKYVNSADVGNSAVYETPTAWVPSGAVGIGTTAPADVLHLQFNNTGGQITGLAVQNLGNTGAPYSGMLFYDHNGVLGQFQGFNNLTHEYRINNIARNGSSVLDGSINFMIGGSSKFFVGSNGNIGIGTTTPGAPLDVSNAIAGTGNGVIAASTFATTGGSGFIGRRARGTSTVPTAVQINDLLAGFFGRGYGATAFGANSGINIRAAENWTDTAQATRINITTTPFGSAVPLNRVSIDSSGNVGIGTSSPEASLEVLRDDGPDSAKVFVTSYSGTGSGGESNIVLRKARGSVAAPEAIQLGDELGGFAATGYGTTGFGEWGAGMSAFARENWTDTARGTALLVETTPLGSADAEAHVVVLPDGNVGIGTFTDFPTITDKLQVFGDIRVGTTGTNGCLRNFAGTGIAGTCSSDRRLKRDITPFGPALRQLTALQPVHYRWRSTEFPGRNFGDSLAYGLIAQDVEAVVPELVVTDGEGFKSVDYSKLPLLTIQAVKELKADNETLKQRVDELERMLKEVLATAARQ